MEQHDMPSIQKPPVKSNSDGNSQRPALVEYSSSSSADSITALQQNPYLVNTNSNDHISLNNASTSPVVYRVYKRRFFGLVQLILLNIVISWNWICFAPVSKTASTFFNTSESVINWASTVVLFAYFFSTPPTYYVLNKRGPKAAMVISAIFTLVGSWIKYGGARSASFAGVMVGQVLIGFGQTFALTTPTTYSNLWFTPAGRTTATAIATLANPFGAAVGQLIGPLWVEQPSQLPNMVLYISIIATVASLPAFFVPKAPPTPPSAGSAPVLANSKSMFHDIRCLLCSPEFYFLFVPFAVLTGFFNAFSSVLNQILEPYGFTEEDAGIAGAILIVTGLVTAAIISPLVDKYKFYLAYVKIAVPILTMSYLIFVFVPSTKSLPFTYVMCALLGGSSFGLVPVTLEYLVEIHYPLGAESSSSLCWLGGQLLGGVFILIMDALKEDNPPANSGRPAQNMRSALIFEAVLAMIILPLPLCLGLFGRKERIRLRRTEADKVAAIASGTNVGIENLVRGESEGGRELGSGSGRRQNMPTYTDDRDEEEQRLSDHGMPLGRG